MSLVDSHCHLDDKKFDDDREAVIERALEAGVTAMVAIGTGEGPPDLEAGIRLAEVHPFIHATVGVHPHDAAKAEDATLKHLEGLLRHPTVVGLGEIGLDYYYDFSPRDRQMEVFQSQLQLASDAGKPIIIHTRDAWDDTIAILREHWGPERHGGIMHCFSGGVDQARQALELGMHVSFAGIVTFPKAAPVQEAAKNVPLDRLLVETDAPYLAPAPKRGKRNEPAYVVETTKRLASLRGETYEQVAAATTTNFARLCLPLANRAE
ncbi:MAG: TatD family hydrolase [bacterium]|nr:TatD family hydrolase [bacterium]